MDESAAFCTAAIVGSTSAPDNPKSEQWNPSLRPIGCEAVLRTETELEDTVASFQGSPTTTNVNMR